MDEFDRKVIAAFPGTPDSNDPQPSPQPVQ